MLLSQKHRCWGGTLSSGKQATYKTGGRMWISKYRLQAIVAGAWSCHGGSRKWGCDLVWWNKASRSRVQAILILALVDWRVTRTIRACMCPWMGNAVDLGRMRYIDRVSRRVLKVAVAGGWANEILSVMWRHTTSHNSFLLSSILCVRFLSYCGLNLRKTIKYNLPWHIIRKTLFLMARVVDKFVHLESGV